MKVSKYRKVDTQKYLNYERRYPEGFRRKRHTYLNPPINNSDKSQGINFEKNEFLVTHFFEFFCSIENTSFVIMVVSFKPKNTKIKKLISRKFCRNNVYWNYYQRIGAGTLEVYRISSYDVVTRICNMHNVFLMHLL